MKDTIIKINQNPPYEAVILSEREKTTKQLYELSALGKLAIITDKNIYSCHKDYLDSLIDQKIAAKVMVFEAGERIKSLQNVQDAYHRLLMSNITRQDTIVSFGGGAVGDFGGFIAATYMRGIRFVNMPTSLLADVDSCIGGKTGVNLQEGKNLVGAFYNPYRVIIDTSFLETLHDREFYSAFGEIIKCAAIAGGEFIDYLEKVSPVKKEMDIAHIIKNCLSIKKKIIQADEREHNIRKILGFGHTVGHALESLTTYSTYLHGEAVAIGMCVISKAFEKAGYTAKGTYNILKALVEKYGLNTDIENLGKKEILQKIAYDKKNTGAYIDLIFLREIGRPEIIKADKTLLNKLFA